MNSMQQARDKPDWPRYDGYKPFASQGQEIRLLDFGCARHYFDRPGELNIQIGHFVLSDAPKYHALSYTWGPNLGTRTISIDGSAVEIRETLWQFLQSLRRHIRAKRLPTKFWVDALCINSEDSSERSQQVRMMAEIFKSAETVFAWIGNSTWNSDAFLDIVQQRSSSPNSWPSWHLLSAIDHAIFEEGLCDILARTFWNRLWIVQEVAHAKEVRIVCGDYFIEWKDLEGPINAYITSGSGYSLKETWVVASRNSIVWSKLRRVNLWETTEASLEATVRRFYQGKCNDPRDKIFGVLSMAERQDRMNFLVDYDKDPFEILLDFWKLSNDRSKPMQSIEEPQIPHFIWLLWLYMELDGNPDYLIIHASQSHTLERILGPKQFKVHSNYLCTVSNFVQRPWTGPNRRPRISHSLKGAKWVRDDRTDTGLGWMRENRVSMLKFPCQTGEESQYDRYWLISSNCSLQPNDACLVIDSQPSDIFVDGALESLPNQSLVIFRMHLGQYHCVGRGKEVPPEHGKDPNCFSIGYRQEHLRPEAQYKLHPNSVLDVEKALDQNLRALSPWLLLNAAAVCEVMQTPWSLYDFVAFKGRKRAHFPHRRGGEDKSDPADEFW